jgi:hypothetical protein
VPSQAVQRGTGRTAHQLMTGNSQGRERGTFHGPQLFDGMEVTAVRVDGHA